MSRYEVFHRTWWRKSPGKGWPNDLEPEAGDRHHIGYADTEAEARAMCQEYRDENEPGELSDKAEYMRI